MVFSPLLLKSGVRTGRRAEGGKKGRERAANGIIPFLEEFHEA